MNTETNRIEYKQELTDDLEKEAIAFLNYHEGGVIYIGIDKKGKPIGVSDIDGEMLKIKDRLKNNIMPSCMGLFDVSAEDIDSKKCYQNYFGKWNGKAVLYQETWDVGKRHIHSCRDFCRANARKNDRISICQTYSELHWQNQVSKPEPYF